MPAHCSRRRFIKASMASTAGIVILKDSRSVGSYTANEKLRIALIGACGQGAWNANHLSGENLVALCDVDERRADETHKKYPQAKRYVDFRKMLDQIHGQIDAVAVCTPDHTHAVAAIAAMKLGKHVYCEKPLTHSVYESRMMRLTAIEQKVMTQMGNQGSATEDLRRGVELAWGGTMGELREAHVWLANGDGPRERPTEQPPVPPGLAWDLWLGPAQYRPYHSTYVPGTWRAWRAFGNGGGGDMGCHTINMAFRALKLDLLWKPEPAGKPAIIRVEAEASEIHPETYPRRIIAKFDFPARGNLPPVKLTWYNGGPKPPKDVLMGHIMTAWGCLVKGSEGAVFTSCPWNTRLELLPKAKFQEFKGPAYTLPRPTSHHAEWILACKGGPKPFSNFEIGGPMTEVVQLVHVASRAKGPIEYDPASGKIVNSAAANQWLHRPYRSGWTL